MLAFRPLISEWLRRSDVRFQPKVSLLVWYAWNPMSSTVIDSFQRPRGYNLPVPLRFAIEPYRQRTWEHQENDDVTHNLE
jgi:hypothetical protein